MPVINSYIYLYHLDKFVVLPDYPESINDSLQSSFAETNALSRTAPVFSYKHSGPRTVSTVSLELHRDMMETLNKDISNLKNNVVDLSGDDYVDTLIKYLQAAALPKYNEYSTGSKTVIPPMVALRFGNDIFIKGIINSAIQITYRKPILYNDKYAVVTVGFSISEVDPYDAETVLTAGSFRGITRTFKDGIYSSTAASPTYTQSSASSVQAPKEKPATIMTVDRSPTPIRKEPDTKTTKPIFKVPGMGVDGPLNSSRKTQPRSVLYNDEYSGGR